MQAGGCRAAKTVRTPLRRKSPTPCSIGHAASFPICFSRSTTSSCRSAPPSNASAAGTTHGADIDAILAGVELPNGHRRGRRRNDARPQSGGGRTTCPLRVSSDARGGNITHRRGPRGPRPHRRFRAPCRYTTPYALREASCRARARPLLSREATRLRGRRSPRWHTMR